MQTMDFFGSQDRARRKTVRLLIVYLLVVAIIVVLVYFVAATAVASTSEGSRILQKRLWHPQLFLWTTGLTLVTIAAGNIYKIAQLSRGGARIALMLGGRLVAPGDCGVGDRAARNVVEEMAIASGTPVPPVYVLDEEEAINAFAAGYRPGDAIIAVSRGALQYLTRDELQGVIAHEFSHIFNGDMRLNLRLIGILHGILMLSYLGDQCLRLAYEIARPDQGKGDYRTSAAAIPLVFLGVGLQMIGFLGLFFGSLIKSAVSKQREYLADASAVQFTRFPDGLAGALKKIGGPGHGSRLRARRAAQFSHMFFGSSTDGSMIDMFGTHPPLSTRIERIEPTWDGTFPDEVLPAGLLPIALTTAAYAQRGATATSTVSQAPEERLPAPVQPLETARLFSGRGSGRSGEQKQTLDVDDMLDQVGSPGPEHLAYASALLTQMPAGLRSAIEQPRGAQAVVLLLLLEDDGPVREKQLQALRERLDAAEMKEIEALLPVLSEVSVEVCLPLVEIASSALRLLSEQQYRAFRDLVQKMIDADQKVDYFEFALLRSLERHLTAHFEPKGPPRLKYTTMDPLLPACSMLLSVLAHVGSEDEQQAMNAFSAAAQRLSSGGLRLHDRHETRVERVDIALEELAQAAPQLKRKVLAACTTCIAHDAKVTTQEAELLRAIADSLDCPLPPLLQVG